MISSILSHLLIYLFGTLRPAYYTYKAVCGRLVDEYKAWSKYWIVYALLMTMQVVTDVLLSWMPLYEEAKLLFVIWIVFSAPQASVWIYDAILHPLLAHRQKKFEELMTQGRERIIVGVLSTLTIGVDWFKNTALRNIIILLRLCLYRTLQLLFGDKVTKIMHKPSFNAEFTPKPALYKRGRSRNRNHMTTSDLDYTEEDYTEDSEMPAGRKTSSHVSFSQQSARHLRRKVSALLNDEPQKFEDEIMAMLTNSNSDLQTTIYTAKDLRRRASRLSGRSSEV